MIGCITTGLFGQPLAAVTPTVDYLVIAGGGGGADGGGGCGASGGMGG